MHRIHTILHRVNNNLWAGADKRVIYCNHFRLTRKSHAKRIKNSWLTTQRSENTVFDYVRTYCTTVVVPTQMFMATRSTPRGPLNEVFFGNVERQKINKQARSFAKRTRLAMHHC